MTQTSAQNTTSQHSTLHQIKQTEKQVGVKIATAQKNAEQKIDTAKSKANQITENAKQLGGQEVDSILKTAKKTILTIKAEAKKTSKAKIQTITEISHNKLDKAVNMVISKLLEKHT